MGYVEELILQRSHRGMDILRRYLPEDFCAEAAEEILAWERGTVLLTVGFSVGGRAETDGPPGTLFLAKALEKVGFAPVVVTDALCRGYFERSGVLCRYLSIDAGEKECRDLLEEIAPVGLISVERCGKNKNGDYANMRGESIADETAPVDVLFEWAEVPTIGIGDGGNEIGMGVLADVVRKELSLEPCCIPVDRLVIATVSNWGALGLCACLGCLPTKEEMWQGYLLAQKLGYVDGVTRKCGLSEDGFSLDAAEALRDALEETVKRKKTVAALCIS